MISPKGGREEPGKSWFLLNPIPEGQASRLAFVFCGMHTVRTVLRCHCPSALTAKPLTKAKKRRIPDLQIFEVAPGLKSIRCPMN